jgi:uncharacterized repeat protein (TIGR01451 family)
VLSEETTISPTEAVQQTNQPTEESQTTPPVEATPTVLPNPPPEELPTLPAETLSAVVLDGAVNTEDPNFDFSVVVSSSATLTTDKSDYSPTDTVVIFGENYLKNTAYTLEITSDAGDYAFSTNVTSSDEGVIEFSHQLDGTYRPNYTVTVMSEGEEVISSTKFTDSMTPSSGCIFENSTYTDLNCTANDVEVVGPTATIIDSCDFPGDTATFNLSVDIEVNANDRYDLGLWISTDKDPNNDGSYSGQCASINLNIPPASNTDGDACGDVIATSGTPDLNDVFLGQITLPCSDVNHDGSLDVPIVVAWNNSASSVCNSPQQTIPETKSKCLTNKSFNVPVPVPGQIVIKKETNPDASPQTFDFTLNGGSSPINFSLKDGETWDSGVKIVGILPAGTYSVSETFLTDWNTSSVCVSSKGDAETVENLSLQSGETITCTFTNTIKAATLTLEKTVITNDGGTAKVSDFKAYVDGNEVSWNTPVTLSAGPHTASESNLTGYSPSAWGGDCGRDGSITLLPGQNKTCTITNDDIAPTLKLVKTITNNNGGKATLSDFQAYIGTTAVAWDAAIPLSVGSYTANEVPKVSGYTASSWTGGCAGDGSVSLKEGENKICYITNDDQAATLIVKKVVNNNFGGTKSASDFSFQVNGGLAKSFEADGQNDITVDAGTYSVTEPKVSGYSTSYDNCTDVVIPNGGTATCTITNCDIAPTLKLTKDVTNDNGGSAVPADWNLTASGSSLGFVDKGDSVTYHTVKAGVAYTLSESIISGYTAGDWDCDGGSLVGNVVTLNLDEDVTCTIDNDDQQSYITVIKIVNKDNGGNESPDDFDLTLAGGAVLSGVANPVKPGTYQAGETLPSGYTFTSFSGDCDENGVVTVALGESKTCTITNDDIAPKLTLVKDPTNNNGGNALPDDFKLTIGGNAATSGVSYALNANTPYVINETQVDGYTFVSISGDAKCPRVLGGTVTLDEGDDITCTIKNDDTAPALTLVKEVTNDEGGDNLASEWTLSASGADGFSETGVQGATGNTATVGPKTVKANTTYSLSESGPSGYTAGDWTCVGGTQSGSTITLAEGQTAVCTIHNCDKAPKLTLIKEVTNDNGGDNLASEWTLTASGSGGISGNGVQDSVLNKAVFGPYAVSANVSYLLSESGPSGYTAGGWSCVGGTIGVSAPTITLSEGDEVICTIMNDDIVPTLTLVKEVTNDEGGNNQASEWILTAAGDGGISGNGVQDSVLNKAVYGPNSVKANTTYSLSESGPSGYTAGDWGCIGATQSGSTITLLEGQSAICTIRNCDEAPSITLIKEVVNDDGGTADENDFGLTIGGTSVTSSQKLTVNANTPYALDEAGLDGYSFVSLKGDAKCPRVLKGTVTLDEGEDVTCTITNDDVAPTLNLIKVVNSGAALPANWQLTASGSGGFTDSGNSVTYHTVLANEAYTLSESGPSGYSQLGSWQCDGGDLTGDILTLDLAEDVSCTVTNTRDTGTITIIKNAIGGNDTFGFTIGGETGFTPTIDTTQNNSTGLITVATGFYTVSESSIPTGWNLTSASCVDDTKTEVTTSFSVDKGDNITCTFTNTKYGSIQGRKYEDLNGSGNWDGGESYLNNWIIHLFDSGWTQLAQMETGDTGETGQYKFASLLPGTYYLCEDLKSGWTQTEPASGEVRNSSFCRTEVVNAGDILTTKHFGNFKNTYIQGRKFNDINANALQDLGEPNLNGWTIRLYASDWKQIGVDQLTHNIPEEGRYRFENLFKGTYYVCEVLETADWSQTYPGASEGIANLSGKTDEAPFCHRVVISRSGQPVTGKIFGNVELSDIHGYKWEDVDEDGNKNGDEKLLGGWTINLYKWNGRDYDPSPIKTMLTDSGSHLGWYWFEDLLPGQYKICEVQQGGWRQTYPLNQDDNCHVINLPISVLCEYRSLNAIAACDEYNFGNVEEKPNLELIKSNNSGGNSSAGATVTYTISVTNSGNVPVLNVTVYDVLPGGFTYVTGSTKINGVSASDPSISGGKLSWNVGTLGTTEETKETTVEYQAKLDSELKEGVFTNVAVCTGNTRSEKYVECNTDTSNVGIGQSVDISASIKGQVLGMTLPATGSETWILYLLLMTLFAGITLRVVSYTLKKKD